MKKISNYILIGVFALTLFGCEKYLDVNTDPNNPQDVTADFILPAAQTSVAITMGNSYFNLGGFWSQYYTQSPTASQYKKMEAYNLTTDFFDREWSEAYAGGLNDLEIIRSKSTVSGDHAYYLIATLLQAYTYQMLADLYDDIPFFDALKGVSDGTLNPKFDNGADIYPVLLERIDEAMTRYQDADEIGMEPGDRDLIYGGDLDQWLSFGNTLKLKMYMRMSYTSMANPTAVQDLLTAGNFITANAAITQFGDESGKRNPFYDVQYDFLSGVNQRASKTLFGYLEDNEDPRLAAIYNESSAGGQKGHPQGDYDNLDVKGTDLSEPNISATTPVFLMTLTERDFLIAEAEVRYNAGAGAQVAYESGIANSLLLHGIAGADSIYQAGGAYEYAATGDVESDIGQIMMQKWVAMANVNNLEGFFEMNRTHYPPLSAAPKGTEGAVGELTTSFASILPEGKTPKRLFLPDVEIQRNSSGVTQVSNIYTKVWWDKK